MVNILLTFELLKTFGFCAKYNNNDMEFNMNNKNHKDKSIYGRPSKDDCDKRSNAIKLSCTDKELEIISQRAEAHGYKQISRYVHDYIFDSFENNKVDVISVPEINHEVVSQLTGACRNLNQVAHLINSLKGGGTEIWSRLQYLVESLIGLSSAAILFATGRNDEGNAALRFLDGEVIETKKFEISFRYDNWIEENIVQELLDASHSVSMLICLESIINGKETPNVPLLGDTARKLEILLFIVISYFRGHKELGDELLIDIKKDFYNGNS